MSNFFFSHNVFYSVRKMYPHLSIFLTSYLFFAAEVEEPKIGIPGKGLSLWKACYTNGYL